MLPDDKPRLHGEPWKGDRSERIPRFGTVADQLDSHFSIEVAQLFLELEDRADVICPTALRT
jgi:hypothetical protein